MTQAARAGTNYGVHDTRRSLHHVPALIHRIRTKRSLGADELAASGTSPRRSVFRPSWQPQARVPSKNRRYAIAYGDLLAPASSILGSGQDGSRPGEQEPCLVTAAVTRRCATKRVG